MAFPLLNIRFILLISASFVAIFLSLATYFCLPLIISHVIQVQMTLSPTSGSYNGWRLNSVFDEMYLYNITNLSDLMAANSGGEQSAPLRLAKSIPKFQQVGPFTFRQDREKINIKFDQANETVVYDQKKSWTFVPELSVVKSIEEMNSLWINHISVPLAGTTLNDEYGEFIDPIVQENDLRLFLNHSVSTLLFEGYPDILMEQAKSSGQVDVDRFGWMYNQNNSISKAMRVFTGTSNATLDKFGSVDQIDHKRRFNIWHNNNTESRDFTNVSCNEFRYSSAGEFFPPPEHSLISHNYYFQHNHQQEHVLTANPSSATSMGTLKPDELNQSFTNLTEIKALPDVIERDQKKLGRSISILMPDLCRTFQLFYAGSYYYRELHVDRYIANEFTYVYQSSDASAKPRDIFNNKLVESNKCYCVYNETSKMTSCPPNGLMDLYSCRKGSPVSISFPHFLYSTDDKSLEPNLRLFQDEVRPNELEHQFFMDLESTLNVPVNVQIVYQFNVHLRNEQSMNFTKEYSFLFEEPATASMQSDSKSTLRDLYLPQMWIKSRAQIDDKNLKSLLFIQKHLNLITPITTIIIFGVASILLLASAKLAYDLTYGPAGTGRKSISCDRESCSSLDGRHQCTYLENKKKKYFDLHLLTGEKNHSLDLPVNSSSTTSYESNQALPSTSKKVNNFVITSSSLGAGRVLDSESQPLNG